MRGFFVIRLDVSNRQIAALVVIERIDLYLQGYSLGKDLASSPHAIKFRLGKGCNKHGLGLRALFLQCFQ